MLDQNAARGRDVPISLLLPSERVRGIRHASSGVPVPEQECANDSGGTSYTPRQTFPAEEEAQECHPQSRAATEMYVGGNFN